MKTKIRQLDDIYRRFAEQTAPSRQSAACAPGCAFCCTDAGRIDITTLEGLAIRQRVAQLPRPRQTQLKKALARDVKQRERGRASACPFLSKRSTCLIYDARPFACRRIHSLERCGPGQPPVIHRSVMECGQDTIRRLQALDDTGYSGHIGYILQMLDAPAFLSAYLSGDFEPAAVRAYGQTHGLVINRMMGKRP